MIESRFTIGYRTRDLIARELCNGNASVSDEETLRDDLGADSFDLWALAPVLEDAFNITITDKAICATETVGDVVDLVRGLVVKPEGAE
ncbi:phosphopantetheine-binding protein [Bauldia litoralis]|uniref:phosphopantetheine-binding protein n=1 Tax=Bauldia litoralis TaxID=665467 RepID=UPI003265AF26